MQDPNLVGSVTAIDVGEELILVGAAEAMPHTCEVCPSEVQQPISPRMEVRVQAVLVLAGPERVRTII